MGDEILARPAGEIRGVRGDRAGIPQERARVRARGGERDARAEEEHALGGHGRARWCAVEMPVPRVREETTELTVGVPSREFLIRRAISICAVREMGTTRAGARPRGDERVVQRER